MPESEHRRAYRREWQRNRRTAMSGAEKRARHRRQTFGMDAEQSAMADRATICPLCLEEFGEWRSATTKVIDHDHDTGEVRGVVCARCNKAEGHLSAAAAAAGLTVAEYAHRLAAYLSGDLAAEFHDRWTL